MFETAFHPCFFCDKKAQLLPYSWYLRDLKTKNAGIIKNSEMQVIHETIMQDL